MDSFGNQLPLLIKRQGCVREVNGCSAAAKLDGHFHMKRKTPQKQHTRLFSVVIGQPECKLSIVCPITFQVLLPFQMLLTGSLTDVHLR